MSYRWKTLAAFGIIYFVWGSTYIFIRDGVHAMPPLIFAALRFFTAGLLLMVWTMARREPWPTAREWGSICLLGALIFVGDYGLLFWAELKVPSGIAAVMMATIPVFIAMGEVLVLRTVRMTVQLGGALLIGVAGVGVLMSRSLRLGTAPISTVGAVALIVASIFWSVASVITRKLPAAFIEDVERGRADAGGRSDAGSGGDDVWRVGTISSFDGARRGVVRAGVPDRDGIDRGVHVLCVADPS